MEKHNHKCGKRHKIKHKLRPLPTHIYHSNKAKSNAQRKTNRPVYKPCDPQQNSDLNYELWNDTQDINSNEGPHQQNRYSIIKNWLKQGIDTLPKPNPKDKHKKFELSEKSKEIQEKRKEAATDRNPQLLLQLNKEFIKTRREDTNGNGWPLIVYFNKESVA